MGRVGSGASRGEPGRNLKPSQRSGSSRRHSHVELAVVLSLLNASDVDRTLRVAEAHAPVEALYVSMSFRCTS